MYVLFIYVKEAYFEVEYFATLQVAVSPEVPGTLHHMWNTAQKGQNGLQSMGLSRLLVPRTKDLIVRHVYV